jgi:Asp-tRNA(Asn)/Glu-tRNA(Gln) amidotransferase A subunit family amidase
LRRLNGPSISVKDNIDIAGHKNKLCNQVRESAYPAKIKITARFQALIDAGAVIVGKTKLQAMAINKLEYYCSSQDGQIMELSIHTPELRRCGSDST